MSYCPEHGTEMTLTYEDTVVNRYLCNEECRWEYNGEMGAYYFIESEPEDEKGA